MADTPPEEPSAHLVEVFSSVQGEGMLVGERQIFIRFYGCHLNCQFCDTPDTITARQPAGYKPGTFKREKTPGRKDFEELKNPIGLEPLLELLTAMDNPRGLHHSVAITGGEPLVHVKFLERLMPRLKASGLHTYLETAGDLPKAFESVCQSTDYIGMDIKLPSVTKDRPRWDEHKEFLRICASSPVGMFIKVIVSGDTDPADLKHAADMVSHEDNFIPFYIQPMTPQGDADLAPTPEQLLTWQKLVREHLLRVRVVPQCHKMMGQL